MAYAINPGDIVEVTYRGTLFQQTMMTVLHYRCDAGAPLPNGDLAIQSLLSAMAAAGNVRDKLTACQCPELTQFEERGQVVYPTRQYYHSNGITVPGTYPDSCLTANVAGVVIKRPDHVGRGRTGNVHVAGIGGLAQTGGALTLVLKAALAALGTQLATQIIIAFPAATWTPVIWSRRHPTTPSGIVTTFVNPDVRIMHRRTLGVGI